MPIIGARLKWKEGKILYPSAMWKSPSKRRLPKLLVEERAHEKAIIIYLEESWVVFKESKRNSKNIPTFEGTRLEFYKGHYYLMPKIINDQDLLKWLEGKGRAILLWGKERILYIKPYQI